jgi:hypothetical protein
MSGPIGVSRETCGGRRLGIAVPLSEAGRHRVDDEKERVLPFTLLDFDGDHF